MPNTLGAKPPASSIGSLAVNGVTSGNIAAANQQDWYAIPLTAGVTYTFRQVKTGTLTLDSYLYLTDEAGTIINVDDDSGGSYNSLITYTPTTSGTYHLVASGYGGTSTGTYDLSSYTPTVSPVRNARHEAPWSIITPTQNRRNHVALWDFRAPATARHQAGWGIVEMRTARHAAPYDLRLTDLHVLGHRAGYAVMGDLTFQAIANQPELLHAGRVIRIEDATLSCDEDSPVWIARIALPSVTDFALMRVGDTLALTLAGEVFRLIIDGKTLSRETAGDTRCEITASSPLALKDAPFASDLTHIATTASQARAVVEGFIGPTDWQLPDWIIPVASLAFDGVTPLRAARAVVEAIGGLIESAPDGSVVCRRRHPVSIPNYGTAIIQNTLTDRDILSIETRIAPALGHNRVTLSNEYAGSSSTDALEYVATDETTGTLRAYLTAERPVALRHTGNPATAIAPLGEVTRNETEVVEFVAGRAQTRYPVTGIVSRTWRATDLGGVMAVGNSLTSALTGNSLLSITYTVKTTDWRVSLAADEQVQFVMGEAV